jgi:drug/metabolite transporter (DMT)-like permease
MEITQVDVKGRKSVMTLAIAYILISVFAGAIGQILLKQGMNHMGAITLSADQLFGVLWRLGTSPWVVCGLALYVCGTVFWLAALSRVDLSYAYPFASLSYVLMLIASWQLFNETITPLRLIGTLVIAIGVLVVSRS